MKALPEAEENWFVDFKSGSRKYIVFRATVLHYTIGNQEEKALVIATCRQFGVKDTEMNWLE